MVCLNLIMEGKIPADLFNHRPFLLHYATAGLIIWRVFMHIRFGSISDQTLLFDL